MDNNINKQIMTVQNLAKIELAKMNESYYGSEKQIAKEIAIMKASKIEMLYNETIEEWLYKVSTTVNG